MVTICRRFIREASGAAAIEYALLAWLIAIVFISTLTPLGMGLGGDFSEVSEAPK